MQFHVLPCPIDEFLNTRGMNSPILQQRFERELGDFSPDRIERRNEHHLRRLINEQRGAGGGLEGFDVPALSPNDAALHLLGRQLHNRGGQIIIGLTHEPLHRGNHNALTFLRDILLGTFQQFLAQYTQLLLAFKSNFLAQLLANFFAIECGHAFESLAQALR